MNYYCIPSCDKCRAARKLLLEKSIDHTEIDMRKDGIEANVLLGWIDKYGLDAILNRRSATWRGLDDATKTRITSAPCDVIMSNPAMLHRPILDLGSELKLGKEALEWLAKEMR